MVGDNPSGADHQQGRPQLDALTPDYVAGFIDGEGCFSVSVHPHPTVRYGTRWLIAPCFRTYQHRDNAAILEKIREFFGCGGIAAKGPNSTVMTYSVYRRSDLESVIIPFFEQHPLRSRKQEDFLKFRGHRLDDAEQQHRSNDGFLKIIELAFSMNQRGKQRRYTIEEVLRNPQRLHAEQLAMMS